MVAELVVRALGAPQLVLGDNRIDQAIPDKGLGLVVALADHGGSIKRSVLAGRLWSDLTEERARASLRVTLTRTRSLLGDRLVSEGTSLRLAGPVRYDVTEVAQCALDLVADAYAGPFLDGYELDGAELFNDWAAARRVEINGAVGDRLRTEIERCRREGEWRRCRALCEALVRIDPWDEGTTAVLIEALARTEGAASALARYESMAASLRTELGVAPRRSTRDLVQQIRAGHITHQSPTTAPSLGVPPLAVTSLFGREVELSTLDELARAGRPVTVVGPGGVGKTRLLIEFEHRRLEAGWTVCHASFAGHAETKGSDTERVFVEEVAAALGLVVDAERPLVETLTRAIRDRVLLLGLDNVEALGDIERPLVEIARSCPGAQIVLTSRRRLLLTSGTVVDLHGLAHGTGEPTENSDALGLFLDRLARTVDTAEERELAAEACRLVDGHPLAIELAAQWAALASLRELVDLLGDPAQLESRAPGVVSRHRSLDGLVSATADRLEPRERTLLEAASVFAGSFTLDDLAEVHGRSDAVLATLVEHSLVEISGERYKLHPIVRSHAARRLDRSGAATMVRQRHADRMLASLDEAQRSDESTQHRHDRPEDLRLAAEWVIAHGEPGQIVEQLRPYLAHQRSLGRVESGLATVHGALGRDGLPAASRAELRRHAAEASLHAGDAESSVLSLEAGLGEIGHPLLDTARARARSNAKAVSTLLVSPLRLGAPVEPDIAAEQARIMGMLSELLYVTDRRAEMVSCGLGALVAGRRSGDPTLVGAGDATVSIAAQLAGAHRISERYRVRARQRLLRDDAEPFSAAFARAVTALVAAGGGRWGHARIDIEASKRASVIAGRTRNITQVELLAALVAYHENRLEESLALLVEAEQHIADTGFRRAVTWAQAIRAEIALIRGDVELAVVEAGRAFDAAALLGQPEDLARSHVALARCAIDSDPARALEHLQSARSGLRTGSSTAFQHYETHCGYAEVAVMLEATGDADERFCDDGVALLRRYAKALPIARHRLETVVARRRESAPR